MINQDKNPSQPQGNEFDEKKKDERGGVATETENKQKREQEDMEEDMED